MEKDINNVRQCTDKVTTKENDSLCFRQQYKNVVVLKFSATDEDLVRNDLLSDAKMEVLEQYLNCIWIVYLAPWVDIEINLGRAMCDVCECEISLI